MHGQPSTMRANFPFQCCHISREVALTCSVSKLVRHRWSQIYVYSGLPMCGVASTTVQTRHSIAQTVSDCTLMHMYCDIYKSDYPMISTLQLLHRNRHFARDNSLQYYNMVRRRILLYLRTSCVLSVYLGIRSLCVPVHHFIS